MGLRHVALNVTDVARAEAFYVGVLGFREEWRPDPDNLYLTLEGDNLAIHKISGERAEKGQALGHIGIVVKRPEDVDAWATHLRAQGVKLLAEPRTHRDGARSLYCADPDGNAVQILYHPPISDRP
jgi:catechol 2,3-dioxygenase-like lactoylglutathione lyase family enzyme